MSMMIAPFWSGGSSVAPELEFSASGANYAFVSNAVYPASFYDSTGDKTWVARESWDGSRRAVIVQTYNHATGRWSAPHTVSTDTLTNDGHGVPAIVMDHEGYVHCFFGAHSGAIKYCVTTTARDPSAWTVKSNIGTDYTYPKPVRIGTALYLFARGNTAQSFYRLKTTALSGGAATWGTAKEVAAFTGGRFYAGAAVASGTDIHIVATYSDTTDTLRRDLYHFVYDTSDESLENSTGGVDTAVGSQPISKATADASYIVIDQTTNETDVPGFCITPDGKLHLAYLDDTTTPWDIKYAVFSGGSWSAPTTLTTTTGSNTIGEGYKEEICLVPMADNSVELYFPNDGGAAWPKGGDIKRMVRDSGGTWGSVTTIRTATNEGNSRPTAVLNADAELRVLFTEETATELDADAGGLKTWAYGSGGFLPAEAPVFDSLPTITSDSGLFGEGDTLTAVTGSHNGTSSSYQWNRNGAAIGGAASQSYVLTATDTGTTITVTQTAANFVGSGFATSTGVAATARTYTTDELIPAGDMDSGSDLFIPSGDMDSGGDTLLWSERLT